jgi:hypothetical protein
MSLLLGQRKSPESVSPKSEADSPSTTTQVAGVPLLMRLPDLRPTSSSPAASKPATGVTSETDAAPQERPESVTAKPIGAVEQSKPDDGAEGQSPGVKSAAARAFAWRSSLWHLLIPLGLLVLFLAAWAIIRSPSEEPLDGSAETEIEAPDIDTGKLVSPEDLALPEFEPIDGPEESTDRQLSEAAPATTPDAETTSGAVEASVPDSAPDAGVDAPSSISSAPPLLESSEDPRATTADGPHDGPVGQSYNMASNPSAPPQAASVPTQAPPAPSQTSKGFNYPTTDPATYGYSSEANSMPDGQPATNRYSYPTTGAPSLHAPSGAAPGVQSR